jgi:hypothetical protein
MWRSRETACAVNRKRVPQCSWGVYTDLLNAIARDDVEINQIINCIKELSINNLTI